MAESTERLREARGTISLTQEDRFRVETDDGRSLLLTLGRGTGASMQTLAAWAGEGRTVLVRYVGEPDAGAVALEVRPD